MSLPEGHHSRSVRARRAPEPVEDEEDEEEEEEEDEEEEEEEENGEDGDGSKNEDGLSAPGWTLSGELPRSAPFPPPAAATLDRTCPSCTKPLASDTALLACLHTVCRSCALALHTAAAEAGGDASIKCPSCGVSTKAATPDEVAALPANLVAERSSKAANDKETRAQAHAQLHARCVQCKGELIGDDMPATMLCTTCQATLCDDHAGLHRKTGKSKGHILAPLGAPVASATRLCTVHHQPLDVYCATCDALACTACVSASHRGTVAHRCSPVGPDLQKRLRAILAATYERALARRTELSKQRTLVEFSKERAQTRLHVAEATIMNHFQRLRAELDKQEEHARLLARAVDTAHATACAAALAEIDGQDQRVAVAAAIAVELLDDTQATPLEYAVLGKRTIARLVESTKDTNAESPAPVPPVYDVSLLFELAPTLVSVAKIDPATAAKKKKVKVSSTAMINPAWMAQVRALRSVNPDEVIEAAYYLEDIAWDGYNTKVKLFKAPYEIPVAMTQAMATFSNNPILTAACIATLNACSCPTENKVLLITYEIPRYICTAMRNFPRQLDVQLAAIWLCNHVGESEIMTGFEVCGLELAELVAKAMQTFSSERKLLRAAISMLIHFIGGAIPRTAAVVQQYKIHTLTLAAMADFPTDMEIQCYGFKLFSTLHYDTTGKLAALLFNAPARVHEVALATLRRCPDDTKIVLRALVLLMEMAQAVPGRQHLLAPPYMIQDIVVAKAPEVTKEAALAAVFVEGLNSSLQPADKYSTKLMSKPHNFHVLGIETTRKFVNVFDNATHGVLNLFNIIMNYDNMDTLLDEPLRVHELLLDVMRVVGDGTWSMKTSFDLLHHIITTAKGQRAPRFAKSGKYSAAETILTLFEAAPRTDAITTFGLQSLAALLGNPLVSMEAYALRAMKVATAVLTIHKDDEDVVPHALKVLAHWHQIPIAARKSEQLAKSLKSVVHTMRVFKDVKPIAVDGAAALAELLKSASTPPPTPPTNLQPPKSHLGVTITGNSQAVNDNLAPLLEAPWSLAELMMTLAGIHADNSQFLAGPAATVIEAMARTETGAAKLSQACTSQLAKVVRHAILDASANVMTKSAEPVPRMLALLRLVIVLCAVNPAWAAKMRDAKVTDYIKVYADSPGASELGPVTAAVMQALAVGDRTPKSPPK